MDFFANCKCFFRCLFLLPLVACCYVIYEPLPLVTCHKTPKNAIKKYVCSVFILKKNVSCKLLLFSFIFYLLFAAENMAF
jgi:hypothetical protein